MHHDPVARVARGVVAVLSISSGHSVRYLTDQVATGRESYYTGAVAAGEPPGRWSGRGAEALGLTGLVDAQDMTAVYEHLVDPRDPGFRDPAAWADAAVLGHRGRRYATEQQVYERLLNAEPDAGPERREQLRLEAGKRARKNVAFHDATFSVQKSITVLHTAFEAQEVQARTTGDERSAQAWAAHREAVEAAIWSGNATALNYLAEKVGYSRVGHHGGAAGRYIDAHDWTVASFFQHDSRDHDPQLHIHNAILNRVQCADGTWRTIDGASLYRYRGAAAAIAERTTEEHLTRTLGVRFATRPDGKAREVLGIDLFSARRRAIDAKTAKLVEAFETKFGRAPNSLERVRLSQQATMATRRAKTHEGESVEERLDRWDRELRAEVAGGLAQVARDVLDLAGAPVEPEAWSPQAVIETAMADLQERDATWNAPDLTRAISKALPDHLGDLTGDQLAELLDGLTAEGLALALATEGPRPGDDTLPDELRLANGTSAYEEPGARRYATPAHVHAEKLLATAGRDRTAPALGSASADAFLTGLPEGGIVLGADQAAAVRGILTSGAPVETLVGPAGTGKSFVVGAVVQAWQDPALWDGHVRRVVGLASSQNATNVLAGEGLDARNIARWLATQNRLAAGHGHGEDHAWRLRAGDLVIVDESAMTSTADLTAICRHVQAAGAKLLLTGDHRQLAAVGAGGGMDLVASHAAAPTYELAETRRFTEAWERQATLRLRDGDASVLTEYHKHGRLLDCGPVEQAERSAARAWLADHLAGRDSLLTVDSNEQAARVSAHLRAELVRLGRVAETGVPLDLQGTYAGVGDLIQTRRNAWHLAGYEGNRRGPINRETFRVLATGDDGSLIVEPAVGGDRLTLPAEYVAEHVALGYASTVHAAQGRTVDTAHVVVTPGTGAPAFYVGLSRGRDANTAHVTTRTVPDDAPTGAVNEAVHRAPAAVLASLLDTAGPQRSALAEAVENAEENQSIRTPAELLADVADLATTGRTARWLDQLVDDGVLHPDQRVTLAAEDGASALGRLLRRAELAGHDPEQVLRTAIEGRSLGDARQLTNVIHHRITVAVSLDPIGDSYLDWIPRVDDPQWRAYLTDLAETADARARELGAEIAEDPPQWAVESLGPVPEERAALAEWTAKAATVAGYRELAGHDNPADALGPAPTQGQPETYAAWRAAWRALGRPEADRDEVEMSDGQLRCRVRAYEREEPWAPRYVANELAGTRQAMQTHRHTVSIRRAEAEGADPADRPRLESEAAQADALADLLRERVAQLSAADEARSRWLLHTAGTRAARDRAVMELSARGASRHRDEDLLTAEEWLAEHALADRLEDPHRVIRDEAALAEVTEAREQDFAAADFAPPAADAPAPAPADIREVAADEPAEVDEDEVRIPTAEETAATIARAQRALVEIQHRGAAEAEHAAEEARAEQLARWHVDDTAEREAVEVDAGRSLGAEAVGPR